MTRPPIDPFKYTSGDRDAEIIVVGEAWGAAEHIAQKPFQGEAGQELTRMLFEAGLRRDQVLCTNLVDTRPNLQNDFASGFIAGTRESAGVLFRGLRCREVLIDGIAKLENLIDRVRPRLIIGCGNWPLWGLTDHPCVSDKSLKSKVDGVSRKVATGITKWRGSQTYTREIVGNRYPYLPIFHPAAILRDWKIRHVTVHDLRARAHRFIARQCKWEPPNHLMLAQPTFPAARNYLREVLRQLTGGKKVWIAIDLETYERRSISCAGLAVAGLGAICIPFFYFEGKPNEDGSIPSVDYWSLNQEVELITLLRAILTHPLALVTNQNIAYDAQYLHRCLSIRLRPTFDTMVAHHLCWPGTPKSLEYLSSLYCDHHLYWKDESNEWDTKSMGHVDLWTYNCKDAIAALEITHELRNLVDTLGLSSQLAMRMNEWYLAFAMMLRGINYDVKMRDQFRQQLLNLGQETSAWLLEAMPADLQMTTTGKYWFSSPSFQQEIFYDKIGVAPIMHKKTKRPTLDKEALEQIRKRAPWLAPLFDRLELQRSIGVFSNNFLAVKLLPTNRFGASPNICGTETFRWATTANAFDEGGNFQNIPKLEEE